MEREDRKGVEDHLSCRVAIGDAAGTTINAGNAAINNSSISMGAPRHLFRPFVRTKPQQKWRPQEIPFFSIAHCAEALLFNKRASYFKGTYCRGLDF